MYEHYSLNHHEGKNKYEVQIFRAGEHQVQKIYFARMSPMMDRVTSRNDFDTACPIRSMGAYTVGRE
jgi:hypothetical protein